MIQEFVDRYMAAEADFKAEFDNDDYVCYGDIVKKVVEILHDDYGSPDPSRIHELDDGDYQGTLVYVIAAEGYQPSTYWAATVSYGSCSGCDTLQNILDCVTGDEKLQDLFTLGLHIVQDLKEI